MTGFCRAALPAAIGIAVERQIRNPYSPTLHKEAA
jgi:hypothetical protein